MIQAALHGKVGDFTGIEDILTSAIFGRLRYLDPLEGLVPFLETAMLYDPCKTTLGNYFESKNQSLREYRTVSYFFWPRHAIWGEPDLVLIFSGHANGSQDLLLLIECKLRSRKSSHGPDDQLKKYYLAINEDLNQFNNSEICRFRGNIGPIIYLTEMEAFSEIEQSTAELEKQGVNLKHPIFHLRWQNLHRTLCDMKHGGVDSRVSINLIHDDLASYLNTSNLVPYSGVAAPSETILRISSNSPPVFFDTPLAQEACCSYFENLPIILIDMGTFCFFGGNQ